MGNKIEVKLFVLVFLFLVTCIFVYWNTEPVKLKKKPALKHYFGHVDGFETIRHIRLEDDAFKMLDLDDYTYADYKGESGRVNLYIGYYYTANKAYASHSPLICYPSHGWEIDKQPVTHSLAVGQHWIHYEEITTSLGEEKELVSYWYQSRLHTNTQIYKNKIDMAYNKLTKNDEQHAFVRVSIPFANSTYEEAKKGATDFIQAFYPKFIKFINESDNV